MSFVIAASVNNVIEYAFESSESYHQGMIELVNALFKNPGTPFKVIVFLGVMVALVGGAFFFSRWPQRVERGEGFSSLVIIVVVVALLASNGALAGEMAQGSIYLAWAVEAKVLQVTLTNNLSVEDTIQAAKAQDIITQTVAQKQRECERRQGDQAVLACKQAEAQAIKAQLAKVKDKEGWWSWIYNSVAETIDEYTPSADGLIQTIGSGFETVAGLLLWALVSAWSSIFDIALILTALLFPLAAGTSLFSSRPLMGWVSGMASLLLTKLSLLIVWGMVSAISLSQPSAVPFFLELVSAFFSPVLALVVGSGGGKAFQSALVQVGTFAGAGYGITAVRIAASPVAGSINFIGRQIGRLIGRLLTKKKG
ncbi:hypothetical protein Lepto7375DRAFT_0087 [Leptolyngbya sp. PCC 7375]|nr:hypothetical protein Lepto7375DRAFT_0087 [Leptolyngbya sp. PCC 7375]